MKQKVFLGGTCANSTWRDELIPLLEKEGIAYFNPVVEDWTEECIEIEEREKWLHCDIHLYMLTKEMKGVYSIIEFIDSALDPHPTILPILVINTKGMDTDIIKSLNASINKMNGWWRNKYIFMTDDSSKAYDYVLKQLVSE